MRVDHPKIEEKGAGIEEWTVTGGAARSNSEEWADGRVTERDSAGIVITLNRDMIWYMALVKKDMTSSRLAAASARGELIWKRRYCHFLR